MKLLKCSVRNFGTLSELEQDFEQGRTVIKEEHIHHVVFPHKSRKDLQCVPCLTPSLVYAVYVYGAVRSLHSGKHHTFRVVKNQIYNSRRGVRYHVSVGIRLYNKYLQHHYR